MATTNSISQQLLDLLATRNFHPEMLDRAGKPSNAEDAKTFTFDYVAGSGTNYGTMVIVLDSDNEMKIMYGDNLGRTMEGDDKSEFFDFLQHLNQKATSNRWTHSIADINQLKYTMQGMAAIQEGLFEGYYGTKKVSYAGEPTQARLQIVHSQPLGEGDARYRHIDRMFIETVDGERFKLGFKSLSGARAMLEHVRQGGKPYDVRGCHITETVNEIAVLSRFNRASANRILEGVTQELVTEAQAYYQNLRENLKHMASTRGYTKYFESWHPATINEQEGVVDNIKTLFIEQSIDSRIEAALPLLAKIQQRGQEMKEADIFESWINRLTEGTWTLPETPEQLDKLQTLMTGELIVGPDATNATEQLYDLVGDDILFDRLHALADQDPRANAWNDTEVMQRLAELGIEMPQPSAPGNPAEPQTGATAPVVPAPVPQQPVAEEFDGDPSPVAGAITRRIIHQHPEVLAKYGPAVVGQAIDDVADFVGDVDEIGSSDVSGWVRQVIQSLGKGMDEGDNLATFEDINSIRNLAGLPVVESVLTDSTGSTLDHICNRFGKEVRDFETSGEMSDDLYHALYDYYFDDMPYGTKKARDGDPYEYVADRFAQDRGLEENLIAPMAMPVTTEGAGCNMTTEGEYCPEHGLMECGMGMAESLMGEGTERDKHYYLRNDIWRVMDGDEVVDEYKPERYEVVGAKKLLAQYDDDNIDVTHVISPMGVVTYLYGKPEDEMDEGVVGNMFNKAKSMFTKPAAAPATATAAPAPVVPNAATQARIAAAPQGYDPNTGKPQVAAQAAPGAVAKAGTLDLTKFPGMKPAQIKQAKQANQAAAAQTAQQQPAAAPATTTQPAAAPAPAPGGVQGIKSNVDVNTLQKFNGIVDVPPKIKPQIKDAKGRTWTKLPGGWTQDGSDRTIDRQDSTYQSFDDAWRVANGAQPGNVGVAEGNDDPMNYNGAITGSYYESKDGDALLARIKSLALLK